MKWGWVNNLPQRAYHTTNNDCFSMMNWMRILLMRRMPYQSMTSPSDETNISHLDREF